MRCGILSRLNAGTFGAFVDPMLGLDPMMSGNQFGPEPLMNASHRPPGGQHQPQQGKTYDLSANCSQVAWGLSVCLVEVPIMRLKTRL